MGIKLRYVSLILYSFLHLCVANAQDAFELPSPPKLSAPTLPTLSPPGTPVPNIESSASEVKKPSTRSFVPINKKRQDAKPQPTIVQQRQATIEDKKIQPPSIKKQPALTDAEKAATLPGDIAVEEPKDFIKPLTSDLPHPNYKTQILPSIIYKRHYTNRLNHHLPEARYEEDYMKLMLLAAQQGDNHAIEGLFQLDKSIINTQNAQGETPLIVAIRYHKNHTISLLLNKGADPNIQTINGLTALHYAIFSKNNYLIKALLEAGADPSLKESTNRSSYDYALASQDATTKYLLSKVRIKHSTD